MKEISFCKKRIEATTGDILLKKVSLKVLQNSNTCNSLFLNKVAGHLHRFLVVNFVKFQELFCRTPPND